MKFSEKLVELHACQEAVAWVGSQSFHESWLNCKRADWMIWYAVKAKVGTRKQRITALCCVANSVLSIFEKKCPADKRPRKAIAAAKKLIKQNTKANRDAAASAASAADAADAVAYATAYAAYAATAYAADAADAVAYAAAAAVADAVAYATAAAADAKKNWHKRMCKKIRQIILVGG